MQTETTEKKHSKFSASSAKRWLECPASIALTEKAPPARESEYAREGTRAHELLEAELLFRTGRKRVLTVINSDHEMTAHVKEAADYILKEAGEYDLLCETKVDLSFVHEGLFGTVDAAILRHFGLLTVIDFKYGAGIPVDPDGNPQLIYYALGLAHKYDYNFTHVELVVVQPRAEHERGPIRAWKILMDDLVKWADVFKAGVAAALDPFAPFKAGDHCRFCPAALLCPEISNRAIAAAQAEFAPDTGETKFPEPGNLSPDTMGRALSAFPKIELWIEKMREHALFLLKSGQTLPGWKLVEKRGIRKWVDEARAEKEANRDWGHWAFETRLISPAQLEKRLVGDKTIEKWVGERCAIQSSGVTLAPESDKRPAIVGAAADFMPVETVACPTNKTPIVVQSKTRKEVEKIKAKKKTAKKAKAKPSKKKKS